MATVKQAPVVTDVAVIEAHPEVQKLQNEGRGLLELAAEIRVTSPETEAEAAELLGWINTNAKTLEEMRLSFTRPLHQAQRTINSFFKKITDPLAKADKDLRAKIGAYRQELRRQQEEEERRLREEAERLAAEAAAKAATEAANGAAAQLAPPPPPPPPAVVTESPAAVRTGFGTVSSRIRWDFEVVDPMRVPREYLTVDEQAIRKAVQAGIRHIPGVRIFQVEQVAVRR